MTTLQTQKAPGGRAHGFTTTLQHAFEALVGNRQLLDEFSSTAAHYDGLIDAIERAGWDLSKLEKVKHALDETAEEMLRELTENLPDMSKEEERSFLAPFHSAIHRLSRMTAHEKAAFRRGYDRFSELHSQSLEALATRTVA